MSAVMFTFPGSHLEGAPNNGRGFNVQMDSLPEGMRIPCVDEEVVLRDPSDGSGAHLRVHVVMHVFAPNEDEGSAVFQLEPYTYIVVKYGSR